MVPEDEWFKTEQGDGMSRPGRIEVRVSGERIDEGGGCVVVGSGTIALQDRDFTEQ
jgi:predicted PhzF superfamily epimerase YddE/YHI9